MNPYWLPQDPTEHMRRLPDGLYVSITGLDAGTVWERDNGVWQRIGDTTTLTDEDINPDHMRELRILNDNEVAVPKDAA